MTKPIKTPSAAHPITIEPSTAHVVVRVGDRVVADSTASLSLREADYPPIPYIPLADVDQSLLKPSATTTYCPFKGDASYYSISTPDGEVTDAIWTYESPYPAVAEIAGHVAFYPDRVQLSSTDA